jgi:hypothetical protein
MTWLGALGLNPKAKSKSMKTQLNHWIPAALLGLSLSASTAFATDPITISTYDTVSSVINNVWPWYGGATAIWDGTQDHTGNGGGSMYISVPPSSSPGGFAVAQDWLPGSGPWWPNGSVDLTGYSAITFWIKWDTAHSTMSLADFNNAVLGLTIQLDDPSWNPYTLASPVIPNTALNGWAEMTIPLDPNCPFISSVAAINWFAFNTSWDGTTDFWIDDVVIEPANPVPEPGCLALLSLGALCLLRARAAACSSRRLITL